MVKLQHQNIQYYKTKLFFLLLKTLYWILSACPCQGTNMHTRIEPSTFVLWFQYFILNSQILTNYSTVSKYGTISSTILKTFSYIFFTQKNFRLQYSFTFFFLTLLDFLLLLKSTYWHKVSLGEKIMRNFQVKIYINW